MRSALPCIILALIIVQIGGSQVEGDDFRPTPIPLNTWHEKREGPVGTLQEVVGTDSPASVAAVPAHYWEDALRHSVYLTLVRDKIDQLIAKGAVAPSDSKPGDASKEVDDYDLWEKIKSAPFDRLTNEESTSFGDIAIMARGRLMEDNGAYRFAEDETSKEKCTHGKCLGGVKAFWSVKRVRQRDVETSPGKYHYELTFSVTSQTPKVQKKPYENPVRTFTVQESQPMEQQRIHESINYPKRPQRAVWVHKNIAPTPYHNGRKQNQGLDRLFSSLFSDEDIFEEPRHKQNPHVSHVFPAYSKIGYIGSQNDQYQQRQMQYSYKPQSFRYSRPPLLAPPLSHFQPYTDFDGMLNSPYPSPHGDYRYMPSNIVKTTRPAVLPTPVMPSISNTKNLTVETTSPKLNLTENTTRDPEFGVSHKMYNKPKPTPMKTNYFNDHVRPPVYNAPPGVFVTMDKKPFKPMPPLKLVHTSRPMKSKPIDFRPSPQVLDVQFSDPEPSPDSAFRPIMVNYSGSSSTEKSSTIDTNKKRKLPPSGKKQTKKHENIKSRSTTITPDIITANSGSFEDTDTMEWANLLGAFTKTTPMASQREKANVTESFTSALPTTVSTTTVTEAEKQTSTTTTSTTTTTMKPKKRTRPPPKFTKQDKIKKHKRITTTTQATEKVTVGKSTNDLIPQASSAATTRPAWKPKNKTQSTTPMSTSTASVVTTSSPSTTTSNLTTTARTTTTTKKIEPTTTPQPKNKNRYRQSTLILKGTSVKHDRWSATPVEKYKSNLSAKYPPRRKGSNFHGYVSSTPKNVDKERIKVDHQDRTTTPFANTSSTMATIIENKHENISQTTESDHEDAEEEYDSNSDLSSDDLHMEEQEEDADTVTEDPSEENEEQESKDHNEFIFDLTTAPTEEKTKIEDHVTTEQIVITSPHSVAKNKTKCKKKKQNNVTATEENYSLSNIENEITTLIIPTMTPENITPDFFDELLGGFTLDESPQETKIIQSTAETEIKDIERGNDGHFVQIDDDFEDFLDTFERKQNHDEKSEEYEEDDTDNSEEDSPFNNEEENREARNSDSDEYNDYQDRQYSLLELMAME